MYYSGLQQVGTGTSPIGTSFIVGERLHLTPHTTWASEEFVAKVQGGNSAQKMTERKHQGYRGV